jgi:hypothetical protein
VAILRRAGAIVAPRALIGFWFATGISVGLR